ncbi:hypothetical protein [Streptomyces sp. SID2888]|uniref:hypothetical protein n=1 Tax=Streptomyces sp. SID2888 TaxID=2690256 RepID=UPI001369053D|nr:hypothetical protein [Streptomyces sp. SID2888]MYV46032.1 hypothetical protein [Streptomyces sp. SID2888]
MTLRKRVAVTTAAAALIGSCAALAPAAHASAPQSPSAAVSCYDSAHSYSKPDGNGWYPQLPSPYLKATSACADINIKPNTDRYIAVCFVPSSAPEYCQSSYTLASGGQWNTIATGVQSGTVFYFAFRSTALSNGYWAA